MPNSLVRNLSNSKEGVFKFHFTNAQQLDSGGRANIEEDARLRMTDDRYRSVFFCFPGSAVPGWFHFRGKGHSVTINEDLSFCSDDRCVKQLFRMVKRDVLIKITHSCGNLTWSS